MAGNGSGGGGSTPSVDYLVVGAGAMGMAFTDVILTQTDATVALVDHRCVGDEPVLGVPRTTGKTRVPAGTSAATRAVAWAPCAAESGLRRPIRSRLPATFYTS